MVGRLFFIVFVLCFRVVCLSGILIVRLVKIIN